MKSFKVLFKGIVVIFFVVSLLEASDINVAVFNKLKTDYPDFPMPKEISKSPLEGFYEVYVNTDVYYYNPKTGQLIIGFIVLPPGENITDKARSDYMKRNLGKFLEEKAIRIGKGKVRVIKIEDPECTFCRNSYFFLKDKDVTVYSILIPLNKKSEKKIQYILCSSDKEKAYYDAVTKDDVDLPPKCAVDSKEMEERRELVRKLGIGGVPVFIFDHKVVVGFNPENLERVINFIR